MNIQKITLKWLMHSMIFSPISFLSVSHQFVKNYYELVKTCLYISRQNQ